MESNVSANGLIFGRFPIEVTPANSRLATGSRFRGRIFRVVILNSSEGRRSNWRLIHKQEAVSHVKCCSHHLFCASSSTM